MAAMTWSIIARDAERRASASPIASRFFAVGALCPHARSGVGRALDAGADESASTAAPALELLREGVPPAEVVARSSRPPTTAASSASST